MCIFIVFKKLSNSFINYVCIYVCILLILLKCCPKNEVRLRIGRIKVFAKPSPLNNKRATRISTSRLMDPMIARNLNAPTRIPADKVVTLNPTA